MRTDNPGRIRRWLARLLVPALLAWHGCPPASGQEQITGERHTAARKAGVNFSELGKREVLAPPKPTQPRVIHRPLPSPSKTGARAPSAAGSVPAAKPARPLASSPSPPATTNFLGLLDNNTVVPPDTDGAVGLTNVVTALNSQVRIQNRSGVAFSTVSLNGFWASLGDSPDAFDPRLLYDQLAGRWVFSCAANAETTASSILVGVSQTSDPTGSWYLYEVTADTSGANWADYPSLGLNKDWIVVSANMFGNSGAGSLAGVNIYVFSKTNLYANGSGAHTLLSDNSGNGFSMTPCLTFDPALGTEYLIEDFDNTIGELRISTITGRVTAEVLHLGTAFPTASSNWDFSPPGNFEPQKGSTTDIDGGDSRILNSVYRNGSLWATHTVFVPEGGSPTRSAAQWWQISPATGTIQQFGRIQNTAGTNYAYPSIAVSSRNDLLLGFSRFSANEYASAAYAFKQYNDPANTFRSEVVFKAGQAPYIAEDPSGSNRWGDFSSAVVDPLNDLTMWTLQEYASSTVNHWGTWWARVDVNPTLDFARNGTNLILSWTGTNTLQLSTNVTGAYSDIAGASSPYTNALSSAPQRFFRLKN